MSCRGRAWKILRRRQVAARTNLMRPLMCLHGAATAAIYIKRKRGKLNDLLPLVQYGVRDCRNLHTFWVTFTRFAPRGASTWV